MQAGNVIYGLVTVWAGNVIYGLQRCGSVTLFMFHAVWAGDVSNGSVYIWSGNFMYGPVTLRSGNFMYGPVTVLSGNYVCSGNGAVR